MTEELFERSTNTIENSSVNSVDEINNGVFDPIERFNQTVDTSKVDSLEEVLDLVFQFIDELARVLNCFNELVEEASNSSVFNEEIVEIEQFVGDVLDEIDNSTASDSLGISK